MSTAPSPTRHSPMVLPYYLFIRFASAWDSLKQEGRGGECFWYTAATNCSLRCIALHLLALHGLALPCTLHCVCLASPCMILHGLASPCTTMAWHGMALRCIAFHGSLHGVVEVYREKDISCPQFTVLL